MSKKAYLKSSEDYSRSSRGPFRNGCRGLGLVEWMVGDYGRGTSVETSRYIFKVLGLVSGQSLLYSVVGVGE